MSTKPDRPPIRQIAVRRSGQSGLAREAEAALKRAGHANAQVTTSRRYWLEGVGADDTRLERLIYNHEAGDAWDHTTPNAVWTRFTRAYRPAVTDPETLAGLEAGRALGVELDWIRLGVDINVRGVEPREADAVIRSLLVNKEVQIIVGPNDYQTTLRPVGTSKPVQRFNLTRLSDVELQELSRMMSWYAPLDQLQALQARQHVLGRVLTDVEIEMVVQAWSDHCFHIKWKGLRIIQRLMRATHAINHPLCLSVYKDNAGAIQFYDGWALCIKGESHNHPTLIFAFGGIQTKHGGLLRDILGMGRGAYPIGASTIMGTMDPRLIDELVPGGATHPHLILVQSIAGTATYCNPMGVPMMYAVWRVDHGYTKPWALGVSIGILPEKYVEKLPLQKGDKLILLGGSTGRDGVHGATASSANTSAAMVTLEGATVQIGEPITERALMTLLPILRDADLVVSVSDLGAGGLSSVLTEMTKSCGADVDVTHIPVKDASLAAWEKMLSESQERMLVAVRAENETEVLEYCRRYGVQAFVVGTCRDDQQLIVRDHNEVVAEIDLHWLWSICPIPKLTVRNPRLRRRRILPKKSITGDVIRKVIGDWACADQSYAVRQFDSTVQGRTVIGPLLANDVPSDVFVSAPIRGKPYGAVSSFAYNPRWSRCDPIGSVQSLFALAISRTIAAGVRPEDVVLCANWYCATRTPEQRWYLQEAVREAARLTEKWGIPIISGKDSSSGTYFDEDGLPHDVPLTCVPSTLGRIPDVQAVKTKRFAKAGDIVWLIRPMGLTRSMAGSVALDYLEKPHRIGRLPWVENVDAILQLWHDIHYHYEQFTSIATVAEGGAMLQLFHGCLSSELGLGYCSLDDATWDLLGETPASFLVSSPQEVEMCRLFFGHSVTYVGRAIEETGMNLYDLTQQQTLLEQGTHWQTLGAWWSTFGEGLQQ